MAKLLLVDDNPQQVRALEDVLSTLGYAVTAVLNGADALEAARRDPPDLILSDILMPGMDGFTLCRMMKQDPVLRDIPFVFLTAAYADAEDREFGLRLGAAAFAVRPIEIGALVRILRDVLEEEHTDAGRASAPAIDDQEDYLQQYSAAVVRRLEDKVAELEAINQALGHEIEERTRAEEALHTSERSFRGLIEHSPVAMVVLSGIEQSGVMVNAKFTALFGYEIDDLRTLEDWWSLAYPDPAYRARVQVEWMRRSKRAIEAAGEIAPVEARVTCKDGSTRDIQFHFASLGDRSIVTLVDVTAQKQVETALLESEQWLLRLIADSPIAMVVSAGLKQHVLMVNKKFVELFGYTIEDVPDVAHWWGLAYPDEAYRNALEREWTQRMEDAIARKGTIAPMEAVVTCADGTTRHIQFHSSSIGDRNIVTFIDLSAQKTIEEALRKAEQEKAVVLNSMSDLVIYQDRDMRVIWANHAASASVGDPGAGLVGLRCHEIWGKRDQSCEGCPVMLARDTGRNADGEMITPDGRVWHVRGFPVKDAQGQVEGVVEFVTDITERKWAEQQQLELTIERERADIMQRFIGNASHDLRTPLTTIKAHLYLLEKVELSDNGARYVGEITRQAIRLEKLLDDMLSMSRLDAALAFDRECIDLNSLVHGVVDQYRALAQDKQHMLRFEGAVDLAHVPVDPVHLRRAVSNLLANALHYTPDGGEIAVRITYDQDWVQIEVIDSGIGIGADDLPHIFKRFYRADKARSTVSGGAGLGLTIARRIIDGHEGRIEVDTVLGQGSTFRIVLPVGACGA